MLYLGVTGHQDLDTQDTWDWVENALDSLLGSISDDIRGITSLARGADQMFAEKVMNHGGSLSAIIPFAEYERTFHIASDLERYKALLGRCADTTVIELRGTDEELYLAAGRLVVERSQVVVAVWNGKPAAGLGGTGDIVDCAILKEKHVVHINPGNRTTTFIFPFNLQDAKVKELPFALDSAHGPISGT